MLHLARLSISKPKPMLALWVVIAAGLIAVGLGVDSRLSPSVVVVPGTESSHAETLAQQEFGPSVLVPIMLQGPQIQLDAQGPKLVRDLARRPDTRVMSAWSAGVGKTLRPKPTVAMIVASVARSEKAMVKTVQPQIDRTVRRDIGAPVRASVTGQPTIDRALRSEALSTTQRSELWAVAIIFLLCVFLLRSVLAAAVCAVFGVGVVFSAYGVMAILGVFLPVDAAAVALGSLSGLALGVAYALAMIRRFRDEGGTAADPTVAARAATAAVMTTGRAILFGGTALIVCLTLALTLSSMKVEFSLGVGIVACAALSVGAAVCVLPALLVLFGHRLDAWTPPGFGFAARMWNRLVGVGDAIVRHSAIASVVSVGLMVALAVPAVALTTGPPTIDQVPAANRARLDYERIARQMGPGWATPYNVLIVSRKGAITSKKVLQAISEYQARIAHDPRVDSVVGPGAFHAQTGQLAKFPVSLDRSAAVAKSSKADLLRLKRGLGQAGAGASQLRKGLSDAADGAGQLNTGSGQAGAGAGQLHAGLTSAQTGAKKITNGLKTALAGAISLRDGSAQVLSGSKQLQKGLTQANTPLQAGVPVAKQLATNAATASQAITAGKDGAHSASDQAAAALTALAAIPGVQNDPNYQAAVNAVGGVKATNDSLAASLDAANGPAAASSAISAALAIQVTQLADGVKKLLAGSTDLADGISQLEKGNADLATGLKALSKGGGDLTTGLGKLRTGAGQLQAGLNQLTSGSGQLQTGLSGGVGPSGQLVGGLSTMEAAVAKARAQVPSTKDLEQLKRESPGLFDSGYFVLAAIQGAPAADRAVAGFALNLERGGSAGQIVVVPGTAANTPAAQSLGGYLRRSSDRFAAATGTETAVGGPAGNLADFHSFGDAHILLVIAASFLAVALLLAIALRAVPLAIVAVLLNGLTVLATFGILELLFEGSNPPLGGPGYLDSMAVIGIFAVVFGFTAIYEVMLLTRTRELFVAHGDARASLAEALHRTAFVATGSGLVMIAAAIPFATTHLLSVKQFGIGIAIAVVIDAFVVRPLLLPAVVALLGRHVWWPTRGPAETVDRREERPSARPGIAATGSAAR